MDYLIIVVILILILIVYVLFNYIKLNKTPIAQSNQNILILTDEIFEGNINQGLILVDFWADWCMPCKILAPTLNEISDTFEGKVKIGKVDVDKNPKTAQQYNIRSIPTLILFKNGQEINRYVGVKTKDWFTKELNKYL